MNYKNILFLCISYSTPMIAMEKEKKIETSDTQDNSLPFAFTKEECKSILPQMYLKRLSEKKKKEIGFYFDNPNAVYPAYLLDRSVDYKDLRTRRVPKRPIKKKPLLICQQCKLSFRGPISFSKHPCESDKLSTNRSSNSQ